MSLDNTRGVNPALDPFRERLLRAILGHVGFDGWTGRAVRRALVDLGEDPGDALLMFPGGATEMIEAWSLLMDREMAATARGGELEAHRISARVRSIVIIRLELCALHREAARRAVAILALPINASLAFRLIWNTADSIWRAAGDTSSDFSWYTKRVMVAGVYWSTLLFWLQDGSEDHQNTMSFLDRRLRETGQLAKLRKTLEQCVSGLMRSAPSPFA